MSPKKRLFLVGGVILVLALALAAAYFWPKTPAPTPGVDKTVSLHAFGEADVTAIIVTRPDTTLSFRKITDGSWELQGREPQETDANYVYDTVHGAAVLTAIEKLADTVENPADYGLLTPSAAVSVHGEAGVLSTLVLGNKTLDQSAYYTQVSGDPAVYLVAAQVAAPFFYTPTQYLKKDVFSLTLPEVASVAVTHPAHGAFELVRTTDAEDDMTLGRWAMTTPYAKETRAQETEDWIRAILALCGTDVIEGTAQAAEYGLTAPDATLAVTAKDGRVERVSISTAKLALTKAGKERIYRLDQDALAFFATAPFNLLDPFLCSVDITTLTAFSWTDAGGAHTVQLGGAYRLDGKTVNRDAFKDAYLELMMITLLAPKQAEDTAALSKTPVFSYSFRKNDGSTATVQLYEINPQTYLASINGRADYRVDAQKVKTAQNKLNSLL